MVRFDLGPLIQGQMRISKFESAYNSLIIGPRGLQCEKNYRKLWAGNLLMWSDLTFGPSFKVNDGSLALVSCLSGGYKFASVLGCVCVVLYFSFFFSV